MVHERASLSNRFHTENHWVKGVGDEPINDRTNYKELYEKDYRNYN
ncbi:MAG: hypothetical protein NPIRA03_35890 [Nitrospirales bacterium]|nr:MAG: hypothetical protein NPIRA03_35890 [Nitrospirales bacterium]